MKMIKGAISGTLIGIGGGGVLALSPTVCSQACT
jgi:hypothetical protein